MGLLAEHGHIRPHTVTVGRAAFVYGICGVLLPIGYRLPMQ